MALTEVERLGAPGPVPIVSSLRLTCHRRHDDDRDRNETGCDRGSRFRDCPAPAFPLHRAILSRGRGEPAASDGRCVPAQGLDLELAAGELAVCRLAPEDELPEWARGGFVAVVRTPEELSVVCDAERVPGAVSSSGPWRAIRVAGTLDHALTGVLSSIASPLADAGIPIFAISSFDTDYVLVPADRLEAATIALGRAGHVVAPR